MCISKNTRSGPWRLTTGVSNRTATPGPEAPQPEAVAAPGFGTPDEFADFELLTLRAEAGSDPAGGYVRPALARGLAIETRIGVNPFRFGLIGRSDFHSGTTSTEETNFSGALGRSDDMRDPRTVLTEINPIAGTPATVFSASGLTGVWAETNSREAIFDALQRREAFATSGTRIRVRVFSTMARICRS